MKALFFMGILLGLVFAAAGGGSFGRSNAVAFVPTLVTRSDAATGSARAGARIAFSSGRDGLGWEVCVMNADGSGQRNLTRNRANDVQPSWSPDGRRIAFVRELGPGLEVYVMNASGGGQRRVTRTRRGGGSSNPAWSPDGRRIAFASDPGGNDDDVYVINADGNGLRKLIRSRRRLRGRCETMS